MTTSITFRTDAELKAEVEDILEDCQFNGLHVSRMCPYIIDVIRWRLTRNRNLVY